MYKQHINIEDNFVVPLAAHLLSLADIAAHCSRNGSPTKSAPISMSLKYSRIKQFHDHTLIRQVIH